MIVMTTSNSIRVKASGNPGAPWRDNFVFMPQILHSVCSHFVTVPS